MYILGYDQKIHNVKNNSKSSNEEDGLFFYSVMYARLRDSAFISHPLINTYGTTPPSKRPPPAAGQEARRREDGARNAFRSERKKAFY
jgi:hypothetical protein